MSRQYRKLLFPFIDMKPDIQNPDLEAAVLQEHQVRVIRKWYIVLAILHALLEPPGDRL